MFLRYVSRRLNTNENHGKIETDSTQFSSNTNFASFLFFPLFGKIVVRRDWPSIIPLIPNCNPIFPPCYRKIALRWFSVQIRLSNVWIIINCTNTRENGIFPQLIKNRWLWLLRQALMPCLNGNVEDLQKTELSR